LIRKILPIWWAWQWRVVVAIFLANLAFSIVFTIVAKILSISKENFLIISNLFSLGIMVYASLYFLAYVLQKDYKRVEVVIFDKELDIYKKAALK
jgi:hypothetical protein